MKKLLLIALVPAALGSSCLKVKVDEVRLEPKGSHSPGEVLYTHYCASCHGASARGDGPVAPVLRITPPDLTGIAARRDGKFSHVEIASYIDGRRDMKSHGGRDMPVWGRWFGEEIGDRGQVTEELISGNLLSLVLYLESIQEP